MADLLPKLLTCLHLPGSVLTGLDLSRFDQRQVEYALQHDLLRKSGRATEIVCPACDELHIAEVMEFNGTPWIGCQHAGGLSLKPEWVQTYAVDPHHFAKALQDALGLGGRLKPLTSDRAWVLGYESTGAMRRYIFACGLGRGEAADILRRASQDGPAVVLVPHKVTLPPDPMPVVPALVSIGEVIALTPEGLEPDCEALARLSDEACTYAERMAGMRMPADLMRTVVSRELQRSRGTRLDDETVWRIADQCGGVRSTSKALKQLGHTISPSTVSRILQRRPIDTDSVRELKHFDEGVSFQVRNTPKKFRGKRKHQN